MKVEQRQGIIYDAPANVARWPLGTPPASGFDSIALQAAFEFAQANQSDSLLVLRSGTLVREEYWNGKTTADLQQTFSGTKSVFALLVGPCVLRPYIAGYLSTAG